MFSDAKKILLEIITNQFFLGAGIIFGTRTFFLQQEKNSRYAIKKSFGMKKKCFR